MGRLNIASLLHWASLSPRTSRGRTPVRRWRRPLAPERLEDRCMLSVSLAGVPQWVSQGPAPIDNGNNVIGIPNRPQVGAIEAIAVDPGNANRVFVATVNGGIWRTEDALDASPSWVPLTDQLPSLSMGDIEFSPLDPTNKTLFAGVGHFSSDGGDGGPLAGVYETTDGGDDWTQLGQSTFQTLGLSIQTVIPTAYTDPGTGPGRGGQVVLAGTSGGLYRTADGGNNWTSISGVAGTGLPGGVVGDLKADPTTLSRSTPPCPARASSAAGTPAQPGQRHSISSPRDRPRPSWPSTTTAAPASMPFMLRWKSAASSPMSSDR